MSISFSSMNHYSDQLCVSFQPSLQLRGDILVTCFHQRPAHDTWQGARGAWIGSRDVIFRCQFHTCTVTQDALVLRKSELDAACAGEFKVSLPCLALFVSRHCQELTFRALYSAECRTFNCCSARVHFDTKEQNLVQYWWLWISLGQMRVCLYFSFITYVYISL